MCSKAISCFSFLATLLLFASCKWVGEARPVVQTVEIKAQTENCFSGLSSKVESYLKSEISDSEISGFLDCTENVIDDFMVKTQEQDSSKGYSKFEIKSLLRTFLIKGIDDISGERYARLFLVVKRALIGGDPERITREEWKRIKTLFPKIRNFLVDTRPYTKYYYFYNRLFYHSESHSHKILAQSHDIFRAKLYDFFSVLSREGSSLNKSEVLFVKDQFLAIPSVSKLAPLLDEMLYIYYSFLQSEHEQNWTELVKIGESGLRVMTYVKKMQNQTKSYFVPTGAVALVALVKSTIDAFEMTYRVNSSLKLDQEMVERFILSLNQSKLFLNSIENQSELSSFISDVGRSIFTFEDSGPWYIANFKLNQFKFMYNRWVNSLIRVINDSTVRDLNEKYTDLLYTDIDFNMDANREAEELVENIVLKSPINVVHPGLEYKINYQTNRNRSQQSQVSETFYITMMSNVVLFVFDTYGRQGNLDLSIDKKIPEQTATRLYDDIRPIAVAQGISNPLHCASGPKTFLEANLFGFSSNGNDKLDMSESLEWFTGVISNSSVASKIFKDVESNLDCVLPSTSLFLNKPYLLNSCVKNKILSNYKSYFSHMKNLIEYIGTQNSFEQIYENLFEVSRTCGNRDLPVSHDEILYSVSLMQYIETLFERYDVIDAGYVFTRKRNNKLEYVELEQAFEDRFRTVLQRMAKQRNGRDLSESNTKHLFNKLLIYKQLPKQNPEGLFSSLKWWVSDRAVAIRPLDRIDVYRLFNSIITSGDKTEVISNYCNNLTLAWEEYVDNNAFFVKPVVNNCTAPTQQGAMQRRQQSQSNN